MKICAKCQKVYADKFSSCPHCAGSGAKTVAGLFTIGIFGAAIWAFVSGERSNDQSDPKWESISGTQQGVYLVLDIDANSIKRTSDGASASVMVRTNPDTIDRVTYICHPPESGIPGGVIFNGQLSDLPAGSTSEAIMKRVCFGPLRQ
jgi:hypothetical protein